MRITPLDVRKQEFRRSVRGLDPDEVHAFLATVADEYEAVLTDNKQLREKVIELDEKVTEYRNMERTLRDTLITAERVMTEARQNARKEAELILRDAELKAQQQTSNIASKVESLRTQLRELRGHRDSYLARLQSLSEAQIGLLESYRRDFSNEDRDARPLLNGANVAASAAAAPVVTQPEATPETPAASSSSTAGSDEAAPAWDPVPTDPVHGGSPTAPPIPSPAPAAAAAAASDDWRSYSLDGRTREPEIEAAPEIPAGTQPLYAPQSAVAPGSSIPAPPVDTHVEDLPEPTRPSYAIDEVARAMEQSTTEPGPDSFGLPAGGQPESGVAPYGAPESPSEVQLPWLAESSDPEAEATDPAFAESEAHGEAAEGQDGSRWSLSRFTKGLTNF